MESSLNCSGIDFESRNGILGGGAGAGVSPIDRVNTEFTTQQLTLRGCALSIGADKPMGRYGIEVPCIEKREY